MITKGYRRPGRRLTAVVLLLPLGVAALAACSTDYASSSYSPNSITTSATPTPAANASGGVSAAQLKDLDSRLTALNKDPALPAAAQASRDLKTLREYKGQADLLSAGASALGVNGCGQASAITTAANSLQQQAAPLVTDAPHQLTIIQATVAGLTTQAQALQKTIADLTTQLGKNGDPATVNQLQQYAAAADLLAANVKSAQTTLNTTPVQLAKLSPIGVQLHNIQVNVAKRCG
jgi:hypothetical protein